MNRKYLITIIKRNFVIDIFVYKSSHGIVQVQQKGQPKQSDISEIDEDYMYPGTENPIEMVNYIVVKLGCKFDLTWYISYIYIYIFF